MADGARDPLEKEATGLYREVLHSLHDGTTAYLIDDYLSSIKGLIRNPTRCGTGAVHLTVRGQDHSRSLTYLVNAEEIYPESVCPKNENEWSKDGSQLNSIAARLTSAAFAVRRLSEDTAGQPLIDVSFILPGWKEKHGHQYLNVPLLREALLSGRKSAGPGTHLILIESTGLRVCSVQKGCLIFRLDVKGRLRGLSFPWLGATPWEASVEFRNSLDKFMKPRHELYPLDFGKAPSATLSSFLIGYPTMVATQVDYEKHKDESGGGSLASEYYVSLPPEFDHEELERRLHEIADEVARRSGCTLSVSKEYLEETFRENPRSPVVSAICKAFTRLTGFEPILEWLPFPISAKELKASGFAKDLVAFGPGDWTEGITPNERGIVEEILKASLILAQISYEKSILDENTVADWSG